MIVMLCFFLLYVIHAEKPHTSAISVVLLQFSAYYKLNLVTKPCAANFLEINF